MIRYEVFLGKSESVFVLYEANRKARVFNAGLAGFLIILIDPVSTHKQRGIKTKPAAKKLTLSQRKRSRLKNKH